ncbi:MAG: nitrilase-related carbon-nitrogen hydrolase, partial [Rhabdochlamydiaceae bacterium]
MAELGCRCLVKVAVAQMLVQHSATRNLQRILKFLEMAARQRSDIVCFPETCLIRDEKQAASAPSFFKKLQFKCRQLSVSCV